MQTRIQEIIDDLKRDRLVTAGKKIRELDNQNSAASLTKMLNTKYSGKLILNEVVRHHDEVDLVDHLLRHGADPAQCDNKYDSALSLARELGKTKFLEKLEGYERSAKKHKACDESLVFSFKRPKKDENSSVKNNSSIMFQPLTTPTLAKPVVQPQQINQQLSSNENLAMEALLVLVNRKR